MVLDSTPPHKSRVSLLMLPTPLWSVPPAMEETEVAEEEEEEEEEEVR